MLKARYGEKINPKEIEKLIRILSKIPSFEIVIVNGVEIPLRAPWSEIQAYLRGAFND
ncbi:MAG: hypothetical protein QXL46_04375 [Nitrososphaerales archaeon]